MITQTILDWYFDHGRELIRIGADGKRPHDKRWTTRPALTMPECREHVARGLNLGYRIGADEVVIDIDPRNGGVEGRRILLANINAHRLPADRIDDLADMFPTVCTGGGGWHYYATLPHGTEIKGSDPRYGIGVEFKRQGHQVVIAGSTHPSGGDYMIDEFSPFEEPAPGLPPWLVAQIAKPKSPKADRLAEIDASRSAPMSSADLAEILRQLPADDYSNNDTWLPLMMSCHDATNGDSDACEVFLAWCAAKIPGYQNEEKDRLRWQSCRPGGGVTVATLYAAAAAHGAVIPSPVKVGDLPELDPQMPGFVGFGVPMEPVIRRVRAATAADAVAAITPASSHDEIQATADQIVAVISHTERDRLIIDLRRNAGIRSHVIKRIIAEAFRRWAARAQNEDVDDVGNDVSEKMLRDHYQIGDGWSLMHAADGQWWEWHETHWEPCADNLIERSARTAAMSYKAANPQISSQVAGLISSVVRITRARVATPVMPGDYAAGTPPIINCKNGQILLDDSGRVTFGPHNPADHLTYVLGAEYSPEATCPRFDRALQEIFCKSPDPDDLIRHLWEIIGYAMQPNKDLATWVLFYGPTAANGKSTILHVIEHLLGPAALCKQLTELDISNNNHALADLPGKLCVIDDDLDCKSPLPDSTLKKISENKIITANPKGRAAFQFRSTAICIFASNELPKIKDMTNGMRRRAHVIPFLRKFSGNDDSDLLKKYLSDFEMGGILNRAIEGLQRLRARGGWKLPDACAEMRDKWIASVNPVAKFASMYMVQGFEDQNIIEVYKRFRTWAWSRGIAHPIPEAIFESSLISLGWDVQGSELIGVELSENTPDAGAVPDDLKNEKYNKGDDDVRSPF